MPKKPRSQSWWSTLPGMLTGAAGIITAATGLFVALHQAGFFQTVKQSNPREANPPDIVVFDTWNTDAVENGPIQPARFSISRAYRVTNIRSYHWNNGQGSPRGNIGLRHDDGTVFGPWEVSTSAGYAGREHVNWECNPNVSIPAGTYTVVDSDPTTWAHNRKSGGMGMTIIKGHRLD